MYLHLYARIQSEVDIISNKCIYATTYIYVKKRKKIEAKNEKKKRSIEENKKIKTETKVSTSHEYLLN